MGSHLKNLGMKNKPWPWEGREGGGKVGRGKGRETRSGE